MYIAPLRLASGFSGNTDLPFDDSMHSIKVLDLRDQNKSPFAGPVAPNSIGEPAGVYPIQLVSGDRTLRRFHGWLVGVSRHSSTVILVNEEGIQPWLKLLRTLFLNSARENLFLFVEGERAPKRLLDLVPTTQISVVRREDLSAALLAHLSSLSESSKGRSFGGNTQDMGHGFVGKSPALATVLETFPRIARSDLPVLITGETGTGKEVLARAIHHCSSRCILPFVHVNMASIPTTLAENELFGHAAEAYTTASGKKVGLVASAEGGTLFLDEIDSLPLTVQATMLGFLERKVYRPLGMTETVKANVRIICATNADLALAVKSGLFRQDLLYRVNTFHLHLPPLRERLEDLPLLVDHFLQKHTATARPICVSEDALEILRSHSWPGNVRELEHVIQRSLALSNGPVLGAFDIERMLKENYPKRKCPCREPRPSTENLTIQHVQSELAESGGNVSLAARRLGIHRTSLYRLLGKYRIDWRTHEAE